MICVGTTLCAFAMTENPALWGNWFSNAEAVKAASPEPVHYFAAIELDSRGLAPFGPFLNRLAEVGGTYWTYTLDDGRTEVTTKNRLNHITMGQNLVSSYCTARNDVSHLLFMAADCQPPSDAIPKLLEVKHPLVGGEVSTYCLSGPQVTGYPFPVQAHMATAAFIFIERQVFKKLRWRFDGDEGLSDDPAYHKDAQDLLGIRTLVRKDCIGKHYPESIGPLEGRGYDLKVFRD